MIIPNIKPINIPIKGKVHQGRPKFIDSQHVKNADIPTIAYVAKENIPAVPMISVQHKFIEAYIPNIPPAVKRDVLFPSGKINGATAKRAKPKNQKIGLLSPLIFSAFKLFLL